ncbi:MAG: cupin domain-containing protein [Clostridiales bacterium]|nr:cupin domain-containing protein [Clostridiales bacterium]
MKTAEYYIEKLGLENHIEGGYFKQSYLAEDEAKENKKLYSSIYFLLKSGEVSNFHRLKSDELWYYHDGEALTIYIIDEKGKLVEKKLGLNIEEGEVPQILVEKGSIFGSATNKEGFSLVGCMVASAFTYEDFELFGRKELLELYPDYKDIIIKLTRDN